MNVIRLILNRTDDGYVLRQHVFTSTGLPIYDGEQAPFQAHVRGLDGTVLSKTGVYIRDHMEVVPDEPGGSPRRIPLPDSAPLLITVPDHPDADHVSLVKLAPEPHPSLTMGELQRGMLASELRETEIGRFKIERG